MVLLELWRQVTLGNEWPCSSPAWGRTTSQPGRPEADGQSAAAKEGFSPLHKAARLTQMPNYKRKCELPSSLGLFYGRAGFNVGDVCRPGLCWRKVAAGAAPHSPLPHGHWQSMGWRVIGFGVSVIQGDESPIGFLPTCPTELDLEINVSSPMYDGQPFSLKATVPLR